MSYDRGFFGTGIPLNNYIVQSISNQWNRIPCFNDEENTGGIRCVNDLDYYIPFKSGDVLTFQFQNPNFCASGLVSVGADGECDVDYINGGVGFEVEIFRCCDDALLASYDLNSPEIQYTFSGFKYKNFPFSEEEIYCYQNIQLSPNVCGCCPWVFELITKTQPATGFYVFVNGYTVCDTLGNQTVAGYSATLTVEGSVLKPIYVVTVTTPDCAIINSIYIEDIDTTIITNNIRAGYQDCTNVTQSVGDCFYLAFKANGQYIGYSQQYKCLSCNETTIFIEGEYSKFDYEDTYYANVIENETFCADTNTSILYKNTTRLRGSFTRIEDKIERTITDSGCVSVSSKRTKQYKLKTELIPYFMMDKVSSILASKKITIGRNTIQQGEYILREDPIFKTSGIRGNTMFSLEAIFEVCKCETEFNC